MKTFKNYIIADGFSLCRIAVVTVSLALIILEERQILT